MFSEGPKTVSKMKVQTKWKNVICIQKNSFETLLEEMNL